MNRLSEAWAVWVKNKSAEVGESLGVFWVCLSECLSERTL